MSEKILVTGGAGYVGAVLVPKLVKRGHDVRVLDWMMFGYNPLKSVRDKCEIIKGDVRDSELVKKSLEGVNSVVHLAAISNDPSSDLDPELTRDINFRATKNLVEESKKQGVSRFIYASSSSVYGIKDELNVTEDLPLDPLTVYSETKVLSEEIVRDANSDYFATFNLRPATICGYSPRMRLDLTVNILTEHAINRGKIIVFGGSQKRPNIHIEDVTDYYADLVEIQREKIAGQTFNAGYENHSVMQIAEMVKEVVGPQVVIERTETNDLRSYHISSDRIMNSLGFTPKMTIYDAVSDIQRAFLNGLILDPNSQIYRNIEVMKRLEIK